MAVRTRRLILAATLAFAGSLPTAAQGPVQAVPRAGVSFPNTVSVRGWIESIDTETRTMVFTTPEGRLVNLAVGDSVKNLDSIPENAAADITYTEIVTLLNLRQKGPGSREARRDSSKPDSSTDIDLGRHATGQDAFQGIAGGPPVVLAPFDPLRLHGLHHSHRRR